MNGILKEELWREISAVWILRANIRVYNMFRKFREKVALVSGKPPNKKIHLITCINGEFTLNFFWRKIFKKKILKIHWEKFDGRLIDFDPPTLMGIFVLIFEDISFKMLKKRKLPDLNERKNRFIIYQWNCLKWSWSGSGVIAPSGM